MKLVAAETNPLVYVYAERVHTSTSTPEFFRVYIKNIGRAPARDIHITPKGDFPIMLVGGGEDLPPQYFSKVPMIVNGIEGLAPNEKLQLARVTLSEVKTLSCVPVNIDYKNALGKKITHTYSLDFPSLFSSFRGGQQ